MSTDDLEDDDLNNEEAEGTEEDGAGAIEEAEEWGADNDDEGQEAQGAFLSTPRHAQRGSDWIDPDMSPIWGRPGERARDSILLPEDANVRRRLLAFQTAHNLTVSRTNMDEDVPQVKKEYEMEGEKEYQCQICR